MFRIVNTLIEMLATAVYVVPIFLLCNLFFIHSTRRTLAYISFGLYLSAVLILVGFPDITSLKVDFSVNVLPFAGMKADIKNEFLNILLFIPLGCSLPILWSEFRNIKAVLIIGIITSCIIEISQIFTFRLTDINDLITNAFGTIIGFIIFHLVSRVIPDTFCNDSKIRDFFIVYISVIIVMFFIQPCFSSILWAMVL